MRLLLLLTSHNSLSQRFTTILDDLSTYTGPNEGSKALPNELTYTIEYAISEDVIIAAVEKVRPDVIVGAFLTKKIPKEVWSKYMTLILHPGPPGDAGPSAIDWALMGDSGIYEDASEALLKDCLEPSKDRKIRAKWGVTCLQAEEKFDEGPTWAFETFDIPAGITKSGLYRGPVTQAACLCMIEALSRIHQASLKEYPERHVLDKDFAQRYPPTLHPGQTAGHITVSGAVNDILNPRHRPLLKPSERALDPEKHTAGQCATIVRAGDSQPGVQVKWLDYEDNKKSLFVYGAWVENRILPKEICQDCRESHGKYCSGAHSIITYIHGNKIVATREGAILVSTARDEFGNAIWITHARLPMSKEDKILPLKLPAVEAMRAAGLADHLIGVPEWSLPSDFRKVNGLNGASTWQQVWVEVEALPASNGTKALYVYFDFCNGACSTFQCQLLLKAIMQSVEADDDIIVVCLMGSRNYFSNGIALNIIEASPDPAKESWDNINAIDDIVEYIMGDSSPLATNKASKFMQGRKTLTERGILTVSAIQANAAAGGLALATCCDITLCSANAVLNPHYRGVGLFGSEFHRYHWTTRMGEAKCQETMSKMLPISPRRALSLGLVDKIVGDRESSPDEIEASIKQYIGQLSKARAGEISAHGTAPWVRSRTGGLPSCASPFDSLISTLVKAKRLTHQTFKVPLVWYRNEELSQMLLDFYHPVRSDRYHTRRRAFVRKFVGKTTPLRFAEHNRTGIDGHLKLDPEEEAEFDTAPGWTRGEEWRWAGQMVPEGFLSHKGLIDSSGTKQSEEQTEHTSLPASVQSRDLALSQVSPSIVDRPGIASSDPVITAIDRQNNLLQDVLNILAVSNSGVQPAGLPNRSSEPIPRTPAKSRPLSFQPATANGNTPQPRHSHDPHSTIRGWNSLVNAQRSPPIPVEIASDPKNPSTIRSTLSRFMSTARGRKSQTNVFQTKDLPQPNEDHSARGSCETTGRSSGRPSQSIKGKDVPPMLYPCYYLAEEDRAA